MRVLRPFMNYFVPAYKFNYRTNAIEKPHVRLRISKITRYFKLNVRGEIKKYNKILKDYNVHTICS